MKKILFAPLLGVISKMRKTLLSLLFVLIASTANAADVLVCDTNTCGNTPESPYDTWAKALDDLPATLVRGNTYWVADGAYSAYTFDDDVSGTTLITIKKATVASHVTETGWNNSYGDGQAVFDAPLTFHYSYHVIDGNGTHTIPSDTSADYGFKIVSTAATNAKILDIGGYLLPAGNITIKYTHLYNTHGHVDSNTNNASIYFYNSAGPLKVQNCFLENSGQDGLMIGAGSNILIERSYIKKLGEKNAHDPDYHGQAVAAFYGGDDMVFRWNIWEANEGQGMVVLQGHGSAAYRFRFYGNVVFNKYGETTAAAGFNGTGGVIGTLTDAESLGVNNVYIYNNTLVNLNGDYGDGGSENSGFDMDNVIHSEIYGYNNLWYNCASLSNTGFDAFDKNASGPTGAAGGTNEQTELASSIFTNYTGNNFRLASNTTAGFDVSSSAWWSGGEDSFFGTVDSVVDMYGNTRTTWSRGAYEYYETGNIRGVTASGVTIR